MALWQLEVTSRLLELFRGISLLDNALLCWSTDYSVLTACCCCSLSWLSDCRLSVTLLHVSDHFIFSLRLSQTSLLHILSLSAATFALCLSPHLTPSRSCLPTLPRTLSSLLCLLLWTSLPALSSSAVVWLDERKPSWQSSLSINIFSPLSPPSYLKLKARSFNPKFNLSSPDSKNSVFKVGHSTESALLGLSPLLFSLCTKSLGSVIHSHSFSCHCCVDDTQLFLSFPRSKAQVAAQISACLVEGSTDFVNRLLEHASGWQQFLKRGCIRYP